MDKDSYDIHADDIDLTDDLIVVGYRVAIKLMADKTNRRQTAKTALIRRLEVFNADLRDEVHGGLMIHHNVAECQTSYLRRQPVVLTTTVLLSVRVGGRQPGEGQVTGLCNIDIDDDGYYMIEGRSYNLAAVCTKIGAMVANALLAQCKKLTDAQVAKVQSADVAVQTRATDHDQPA